MIKTFLIIIFYPLIFPWQVYKQKRHLIFSLLALLVSLFILSPLWLLGSVSLAIIFFIKANQLGIQSGLIFTSVNVSGTGSMYPTFPKGKSINRTDLAYELVASPKMKKYPSGISIFGYKLLNYQLQRGDIVDFENTKTKEITEKEYGQSSGFIKRIIALPGDQLEIRDGFVWLNNERLNESYTAAPRSTFGGQFLPDCQKFTVPENKLIVMGDNRKGSSDSRHQIGFVDLTDVQYVQTQEMQLPYRNLWRDSSRDFETANQPTLDPRKYLDLLNVKRKENNLNPLKYQEKLAQSAALRAGVILKFNDLSFEATRSGYTMEKSMSDVGYGNIVWGEAPTIGYYGEEELLENYFEFPETKKFLLNKDFQETGLSVKIGEIRGCPVQVIVQHLAGYVPPTYKPEDIKSWRESASQLDSAYTSWLKLKGYEGVDQVKLNQLLELFTKEKKIAQNTLQKMEASQWLNAQEENDVENYVKLIEQSHDLATQLNQQISSH